MEAVIGAPRGRLRLLFHFFIVCGCASCCRFLNGSVDGRGAGSMSARESATHDKFLQPPVNLSSSGWLPRRKQTSLLRFYFPFGLAPDGSSDRKVAALSRGKSPPPPLIGVCKTIAGQMDSFLERLFRIWLRFAWLTILAVAMSTGL